MQPFTLEEIKRQASKPISQVVAERDMSFKDTPTASVVSNPVTQTSTQTVTPTVLSPELAKTDFQTKSKELDKAIEANKPAPKKEETLTPTDKEILGVSQALDEDTKLVQETYKIFSDKIDMKTEREIARIQQEKKAQIADTKVANQRIREAYDRVGLREGLSRYAPQSTTLALNKVEIEGLDRLNEIVDKESSLIEQAKAQRDDKQFSLFQETMKEVRAIQKEKRTTIEELKKTAREERKKASDSLRNATKDAAILGVYAQGIKDPLQIFDYVNFDDQGNMIGDITSEEIKKTLDSLKPAGEKLTGDYGEYTNLKEAGEFKGGFFDYIKAKKDAGREGSGGFEAGESGNVQRDADSIMAGVLDPSKLSTKKNYAATVMAEVSKRKEKARLDGDIIGIMKASAGGKDTETSFATSFEKAVNVVGQIADLQKLFESDDKPKVTNADGKKTKVDLSPIVGIWKSVNPYDTKAQAIRAQLSAIVPNLARGIYGEVGVLTDNDVQIYSRTLPNLRSTEEVRKMVLGITIRSIQRSIENKIKITAGTNRDISNPALIQTYLEVKGQADKLLAPYEALNAKDELDKLTLPATGGTSESPTMFWGNAK